MILLSIRSLIVRAAKRILNVPNLTLYLRKRRQSIEKLFYCRSYTAADILTVMKKEGLKRGDTVMVHCAMNNFYNYKGTADELIDTILAYIGEEGTLCMPAYPKDKNNPNNIFDVSSTPTAAGYLAETFRKRPNVERSLNQLHSVCAYGKNAHYIVGEHHLSETCFDEHSPFYKIGELDGLSFNLGLPKWFVGTVEHVCESLLINELAYFKDKFMTEVEFTYRDKDGHMLKHKMMTRSKQPYIRKKSTKYFDEYFDKNKYHRSRLSNIWITCYDVAYLIRRMTALAKDGKIIYAYPKFYR